MRVYQIPVSYTHLDVYKRQMPDASTEIMKESRKFVSTIMWISMFLPWSGCIINA